MTLRGAFTSDAEELADLDGSLFDYSMNEHTIRKFIEAGWGVVDTSNCRIRGYLLVVRDQGLNDIIRVGVRSDCQGQGIGKALLDEALRTCPNEDYMLCVVKTNTAAFKLYKSRGFQIVGELEQSWVMRLTAAETCTPSRNSCT